MPINLCNDGQDEGLLAALIAERDALRERVAALEEELSDWRSIGEQPAGGPPAEIYLQWYGDDEGHYLWPGDVDQPSVTWCAHRVWPRDVRYTRADDTPAGPELEPD